MAIRHIGVTEIANAEWQICQCTGYTSSTRRYAIFVNGYPGYWTSKNPGAFEKALRDWYSDNPRRRYIDVVNRIAIDLHRHRVYYMHEEWDHQGGIALIEAALGVPSTVKSRYDGLSLGDIVNLASLSHYKELKAKEDRIKADIEKTEKRLKESMATYREINLGGINVEDQVTESLTKLANMDKVEKIELTNHGDLLVFTEPLFCIPRKNKPSDIRDIGKFKIKITINQRYSNTTIHYTNLTRKIGNHHAPHIPGHGAPCWGEASAMLKKLYESFMIPEMVVILIQFVESVNLRDAWGRTIDKWPQVTDKERILIIQKSTGKLKPKEKKRHSTRRSEKQKSIKETRQQVVQGVEEGARSLYSRFMEMIGYE